MRLRGEKPWSLYDIKAWTNVMPEVQVQLCSRKGQNFGVKMDDQERNPRDKSSQFIEIAGIGSAWDLLPVLR